MSQSKTRPIRRIQQEILRTMMILTSIMTILVTVISILVNIRSESRRLDQNLENIAQSVARSQMVRTVLAGQGLQEDEEALCAYLDSLEEYLSNIDVISVVGTDQIRRYHTNASLIGKVYDGTLPQFGEKERIFFVTSDTGPSGSQRRAYAAIYAEDGKYLGFVIALMLNQNIRRIIISTVLIHLACAAAVIVLAVILSRHLSRKIKRLLQGYEPDVFSAMFSVRENILESLEEGILAVGPDERIIYLNQAAGRMLGLSGALPDGAAGKEGAERLKKGQDKPEEGYRLSELCPELSMRRVLETGEKSFGLSLHPSQGADILADQIPVMDQCRIAGALCILRDRTEYTKIMEELSGVRYMVESMRANNHDFNNKLHVILGLIQMGNITDAGEYITRITTIQQEVLHHIMKNIEDPSVAALLIGKYSRAAELNVRFTLKSSSRLSRTDISLPSGDLVTIIGNLLDNAMDSLNEKKELPRDLSVGIYTQPHAMLISVDDTGMGISEEDQEHIFENGFSTKGENRGTGLYLVRSLAARYQGTVSVESEPGAGTSFTVTMTDEGGRYHV